MSFKEKVKNFGKVILSILIGIVIAIAFIISLPMIPIISIFDLISGFLVKFRQEKESTGEEKKFTASDALKEALEQFQADSLPDYQVLRDNEQSNVPDLTSDEKKRIDSFRYLGDPKVQELIKTHQDKDEVTKKFLLGSIKLNDKASVQELKDALRAGKEGSKEGSVVRDVVGRITIIPKMFLFLFLEALEAMGLSYVKLPKYETYEKEITAAFSLFNSKASILSNSRSTMEKELAKSLHGIVVDYITSSMTSLGVYENIMFVDLCKEITVKPEDHDKYEKINNKIVEKIAGIFRLLTNVKLGLLSDNNKAFENKFNHEVCNLLKCACFADLNVSPGKMADEEIVSSAGGTFVQELRIRFSNFLGNLLQSKDIFGLSKEDQKIEDQKMLDEEIISSLDDKCVQELRTSFSNFLDNLLQSKAISGLSKKDQADYIDILCTKMLKACIVYGSVYGSNCPALSLPLGYSKHVDNIATHLSNDIIKTLSLDELGTLCSMSPSYLERCINNSLLGEIFSEECIKTELYRPMTRIKSMIDDLKDELKTDISVPDGIKIGTKGPKPTALLSSTSSSQDNTYFNGLQV